MKNKYISQALEISQCRTSINTEIDRILYVICQKEKCIADLVHGKEVAQLHLSYVEVDCSKLLKQVKTLIDMLKEMKTL